MLGSDHSFRFYTHNGDLELANSLGLNDVGNWEWRDHGWIYLGAVASEPTGVPDDRDPGWEIEVEVGSMPAQFWRFTIRHYLDVQVDGEWEHELQVIRFSTGSGGLGEFWPFAKMLAKNMIGMPELVTA